MPEFKVDDLSVPIDSEFAFENETPEMVKRVADVERRMEKIEDPIHARLSELERRIDRLTDAVNSFGTSLQFIVDQVSSVGKAVASGGLGGLMSQFMGGKKNG